MSKEMSTRKAKNFYPWIFFKLLFQEVCLVSLNITLLLHSVRTVTSKGKKGPEGTGHSGHTQGTFLYTELRQKHEAKQAAGACGVNGDPKGKGTNGFMTGVVAELVLTPVSRRVSVGGVSTQALPSVLFSSCLNAQEIPV